MCKWLMVSENIEFTSLQEMAKMSDGEVNGE